MEPDRDRDLIERYSPVLYLDPKLSHYPCSVEYFLFHSTLWRGKTHPVQLVTSPTIQDLERHNHPDSYLSVSENAWSGQHSNSAALKQCLFMCTFFVNPKLATLHYNTASCT